MSQLALPLKLQDHAVFESFLPDGNEALVAFLTGLVASTDGPGGWIRGSAASGKTHLLQAVCERAGPRAQFVPLQTLKSAGPGILEGQDSKDFVCLDDVHSVAGDASWELGLFTLCNALADTGGALICSATAAPRDCGFQLPDLVSRFGKLPAFQLHELDDVHRIAALRLRARHRGLDLPDETANYLIARSKRDMSFQDKYR